MVTSSTREIFRSTKQVIGVFVLACLLHSPETHGQSTEETLELVLQSRIETESGSTNFHITEKKQTWKPSETAVNVCEMRDLHHCHNAVTRIEKLAPRMDKVLHHARDSGATIIHAPSGCVDFYKANGARRRAIETKLVENMPDGIGDWCSKIPSEENGTYPIDHSHGGEDDEAADHAKWAKELADRGLDPRGSLVSTNKRNFD